MLITNKIDLREYLILAPTNTIYLEFIDYYCNIYSIGDTYIAKFVTIQSNTNSFNALVKLDIKDNIVKLLKDLCTKTTSTISFELENNILLTKYKRSRKQLDDYVFCTKIDTKEELLDLINNEVFKEEIVIDLDNIELIDTIYEYYPIELEEQIKVSSEDIKIVKRIFKDNTVIVTYNELYVLFYNITNSINSMCTRVFKV